MIDVTRKVRRVDDHSITGEVFDSGKECAFPLVVVHDELGKFPDGVKVLRHESIARDGINLLDGSSWENVPEVRTVEVRVVAWENGETAIYSYLPHKIAGHIFGIKHVTVPIEKGEGL